MKKINYCNPSVSSNIFIGLKENLAFLILDVLFIILGIDGNNKHK